jgi:redox-sensitive bicupin YhaK (pirin superfamily)
LIQIRRASERGHFNHAWLDTYHTFSFGDYYDPAHMGFRTLRVINEDFVEPKQGFAPHSHRDMEIITVVLEGALQHKDNMGNGSIIRPGHVQRMTAGTGVTHSEFNASDKEQVHLYQIWILPDRNGREPGYEQKEWSRDRFDGRWGLIGSPDGRDDSVTIHQDALVWLGSFTPDQPLRYSIPENRYLWLQVLKGPVKINENLLNNGDGLSISNEKLLECFGTKENRLLLFDLA